MNVARLDEERLAKARLQKSQRDRQRQRSRGMRSPEGSPPQKSLDSKRKRQQSDDKHSQLVFRKDTEEHGTDPEVEDPSCLPLNSFDQRQAETRFGGYPAQTDGLEEGSQHGRAITVLHRAVKNISNVSRFMKGSIPQHSESRDASKLSTVKGHLNDIRHMLSGSPRSSTKPFPDHIHRDYKNYTNYTPTETEIPKHDDPPYAGSNLNFQLHSLRSERNGSPSENRTIINFNETRSQKSPKSPRQDDLRSKVPINQATFSTNGLLQKRQFQLYNSNFFEIKKVEANFDQIDSDYESLDWHAPIPRVELPFEEYKTAQEKQAQLDFDYLRQTHSSVRLVHFKRAYKEVQAKIEAVVQDYLNFSGDTKIEGDDSNVLSKERDQDKFKAFKLKRHGQSMMTRYTDFDVRNQTKWAKLTRTALQEQYDDFNEYLPRLNGGFEGGEREAPQETRETKEGQRELIQNESLKLGSRESSIGNMSRLVKEQASVEQSVIMEATSENTLNSQSQRGNRQDHVICSNCQNVIPLFLQKQTRSVHLSARQMSTQALNNNLAMQQSSPTKKAAKEAMIEKHHENLHKRLSQQKDQFKVPMKFMVEYLKKKCIDTSLILETDNMDLAAHKTIENEPNVMRKSLEHQIRAAYLSETIKILEEQNKRALREQLTRLENKIRAYATECIRDAQKMLVDDWRFLFVQLESYKDKEQELYQENVKLQNMVRMQELRANEVTIWAKSDELIHERFTERLMREGLDEDELIQVSLELKQMREEMPPANYYDKLATPSIVERDALDFSKPFGLFSASINIGLSERLNLLERETVQIYKRKLNRVEVQLEAVEKKEEEQVQPDEMVSVLEAEKEKLQKKVAQLEKQLADLQHDLKDATKDQTEQISSIRDSYESEIRILKLNSEKLKNMFLKELMIKDQIIADTEGMRDRYRKIARELNVQLKIPRHHLEFLKNKGALSHFIEAKITGDDELAKWSLLRAGRREIRKIEKETHDHKLEQERIERIERKLQMYGLRERAKEMAVEHSSRYNWRRPDDNSYNRSALSPPLIDSTDQYSLLRNSVSQSKQGSDGTSGGHMLSLNVRKVLAEDIDLQKFQNESTQIIENSKKISSSVASKKKVNMTLPTSFRFLEKSDDQRDGPTQSKHKKHAKMVKLKRGELSNDKSQKQSFELQQRSHDVLSKYKLGQDNSFEESIEYSVRSSEQNIDTNQTLRFDSKNNTELIRMAETNMPTTEVHLQENGDDADDYMENSNDILQGSKFNSEADNAPSTKGKKDVKKSEKQGREQGKKDGHSKKEKVPKINLEQTKRDLILNESINDSNTSRENRNTQRKSINVGEQKRINTESGTSNTEEHSRVIVIETSNTAPKELKDPQTQPQLKTIQIHKIKTTQTQSFEQIVTEQSQSDGDEGEKVDDSKENDQTLQTAKDTSEAVKKQQVRKPGLTLNLQNFDIALALKQHQMEQQPESGAGHSDVTDMFTEIKIVGSKTDRQASDDNSNKMTVSLLKKKQMEASRQSANQFQQVQGIPKDQQFIAAIKQAGNRMTKPFEKSYYSLRNSIYLPRSTNRFSSKKDFGSMLSPQAHTQTVFNLRKNQPDLSESSVSKNDILNVIRKRSSAAYSSKMSQAERRKLGGNSHHNISYNEPSPRKLNEQDQLKHKKEQQSQGHSPKYTSQQEYGARKVTSKTTTTSIDRMKNKVPIKLESSLRFIEERDSQHPNQSDEDASSYHPNDDYLNDSVLFKKEKLKQIMGQQHGQKNEKISRSRYSTFHLRGQPISTRDFMKKSVDKQADGKGGQEGFKQPAALRNLGPLKGKENQASKPSSQSKTYQLNHHSRTTSREVSKLSGSVHTRAHSPSPLSGLAGHQNPLSTRDPVAPRIPPLEQARTSHGSFPSTAVPRLGDKQQAFSLPRAVAGDKPADSKTSSNPFSGKGSASGEAVVPMSEVTSMQTHKATRKVIQIENNRLGGVDQERPSFEQMTGSSVEKQSARELHFANARASQFQMLKKHNQYFSPKSPSSFRFSFSQEGGPNELKNTNRQSMSGVNDHFEFGGRDSPRLAVIFSQQRNRNDKVSLMAGGEPQRARDFSDHPAWMDANNQKDPLAEKSQSQDTSLDGAAGLLPKNINKKQYTNKFPAKKTPQTSHATRQRLQALDALKGKGILRNQQVGHPRRSDLADQGLSKEQSRSKQINPRIEIDLQEINIGLKPVKAAGDQAAQRFPGRVQNKQISPRHHATQQPFGIARRPSQSENQSDLLSSQIQKSVASEVEKEQHRMPSNVSKLEYRKKSMEGYVPLTITQMKYGNSLAAGQSDVSSRAHSRYGAQHQRKDKAKRNYEAMKLIGIEVPDPIRHNKDHFKSQLSSEQSEAASFFPGKHGQQTFADLPEESAELLDESITPPKFTSTEENEESFDYDQQKLEAIHKTQRFPGKENDHERHASPHHRIGDSIQILDASSDPNLTAIPNSSRIYKKEEGDNFPGPLGSSFLLPESGTFGADTGMDKDGSERRGPGPGPDSATLNQDLVMETEINRLKQVYVQKRKK